MAQVRQFYGGGGVPMAVPAPPGEVVAAWRSHRARLRAWLAGLDDDGWRGPTRCSDWDVAALTAHLTSGGQFLGYTLHEAAKGRPTRLLAGFDPQATPGHAASTFAGLEPSALLATLTAMDASVDAEIERWGADGAARPAEAPLGQVPAWVAVNHFLFDSWVHEHDLMLPAGRTPVLMPEEGVVVAAYALALAGVARAVDDARPDDVTLGVHLTDVDRYLEVTVDASGARVDHAASEGAHDVVATTPALLDAATGREAHVEADAEARAFLAGLATVLAASGGSAAP